MTAKGSDQGRTAPALPRKVAKALEGRCRTPRVREALALVMAGEPLREAAASVGIHHSTLREAIDRYGLTDDWKRQRVRRIRKQHGGKVPAVWARHLADVA